MQPEMEHLLDALELGTLVVFEYAFDLAHAAIEAIWRIT